MARAVQATLQKLFPIKIAVISLEGCLSNISIVSICFGVSFSNFFFRRIRLIAVKAVSVEENTPESIKKIKNVKILISN